MDSAEIITLWVKAHGDGVLAPDAPAGASYRASDTAPAEPQETPQDGEVLPDFELFEELGRGGMGVVHRARQLSLDREVAVKLIRPEQRAGRARERFVAEARVSGALDHPNIVPVHALGETSRGHAFLAMKRVSGRSWKELLHPRTPEDRAAAQATGLEGHLAILTSACNAVAFAHARGIVHRDLKPDNVMAGAFGEVMVMDWGIAVDIREPAVEGAPAPHRKTCNAPAGTPAYMPPELAEGRGADIGPWTDTYLLGAILCEVLTGAPPHRGASLMQVLQAAVVSAPPELGPDVPADLAAVVRRAVAREPADRFQSALDLQAAVKQHLTCRESDRIAAAARARLEAARGAAHDTADARRRLYSELADVTSAFGQALVLWPENVAAAEGKAAARMLHARLALAGGDLGLARAQLEALAGAATPDAQALLAQVDAAERLAERRDAAARRVRRTAGGLAAALVIGLAVGFVWIRAERNEAQKQRGEAEAQRNEAQAQRLAAEARRQEAERARDEAGLRLAQSMVADGDARLEARDWEAARVHYEEGRATFAHHTMSPRAAELGLLELYGHAPRPLLTIGVAEPSARRRGAGCSRDCVAYSPDGAQLLIGGADQRAVLHDARTGCAIRELAGHYATVTGVGFLSRGRAVTSGDDGCLRTWDLATGHELKSMRLGRPGLGFHLESLTVCDGGRLVVVAGTDGKVQRLDAETGVLRAPLEVEDPQMPEKPRPRLRGLSVTPEGHRMFAVTEGRSSPRVWNLLRDEEVVRLREAGTGVQVGALSPDGRKVALTSAREVVLLSCPEGKILGRLPVAAEPIEALAFSPDSTMLAEASGDGVVRLWDVATRAELRAFVGHTGAVRALAFSPDGLELATGSDDGAVRVFPVVARPEVRFWSDLSAVTAIELTPDGRLAVVASEGGPRLVDVTSGATLWKIGLAAGAHGRPRLAAGGRALVYLTRTGVQVADLRTGATVCAKPLLPGDVPGSFGLVVGRDGRRVFTLHTEVTDPSTGGTEANSDARVLIHRVIAPGLAPDADLAKLGLVPDEPLVRPSPESFAAMQLLGANPAGLTPSVRAGGIACLEISPDGTWLACAANQLVIRDAVTGRMVRALASPPAGLSRVAISPDGRRLAACGNDRSIPVYDVTTGAIVATAQDEGIPASVAFSPDGGLLASASATGRVMLFEAATGRRLRALGGQEADLRDVVFSPDGRWLISAGARDAACWDLEHPRRLAEGEAAAARARATLAHAPADSAALLALARYYALRGLFGAARALLAASRAALSPLETLELDLRAGDFPAAAATAAKLDGEYGWWLRTGLPEAALTAARKRKEDEVTRAVRRSGACVDLEDWPGALEAANHGLSFDANDEHLLIRRARAHWGLGNTGAALADARRCAQANTLEAYPVRAEFEMLRSMGDLDGAAGALRRTLDRRPHDLSMLAEAVIFSQQRAKARLALWLSGPAPR